MRQNTFETIWSINKETPCGLCFALFYVFIHISRGVHRSRTGQKPAGPVDRNPAFPWTGTRPENSSPVRSGPNFGPDRFVHTPYISIYNLHTCETPSSSKIFTFPSIFFLVYRYQIITSPHTRQEPSTNF